MSKLIYSKDFSVDVLPREEFLTFSCDTSEDTHIHNEEGRCCCYLDRHTYMFVAKADTKPTEIEAYVMSGPRESSITQSIKLWVYINDNWIPHNTYQVSCKELTLISSDISQYEGVLGFRFTGPYVDKSYGRVSYADPLVTLIDNEEDCMQAGGKWYCEKCHIVEPLPHVINNETDCDKYNFYWACDECHEMPDTCEEWLTEQDCLDAGCEWWDDKCWREGTKKIVYEMPEGETHVGDFRIPIGDTYNQQVLAIKYEIAYTKDCTSGTYIFDMPVYIGGSFIRYDGNLIKCDDQPKTRYYSHDLSKNSGHKYEGHAVWLGTRATSITATHFKCEIWYVEV